MARHDTLAQDGYQPLTEGYQPGQVKSSQKGYTPVGNNTGRITQQAIQPPSGGSSATKPAKK